MIKAGALLYAVFITFVVSVLTGTFLLLNYYSGLLPEKIIKHYQLEDNLASALTLYLKEPDTFANSYENISIFNDGIKVQVQASPWGLYKKIKLRANWKNLSVERLALTGNQVINNQKMALFYANADKPLTIAGNTMIIGNFYSPNGLVKKGYIEGKGYPNDKLIFGDIIKDKKTLPEISPRVYNTNKDELQKGNYTNNFNYYKYLTEHGSNIHQSFKEETIYLFAKPDLDIKDIELSGNIVLVCNDSITISSSAQLNDVIIYARSLTVQHGFKGNFQAFCENNILVNTNCHLSYPTVLCCGGPGNLGITIKENSTVNGDLILYNKEKNSNPLIKIETNSVVKGTVFTSSTIELKGAIHGQLYCNNIQLKTKGAEYQGFIFNGKINLPLRSPYYMQSHVFNEKSNASGAIKWLN